MLGRDFNSRGMETCRGSLPPPRRPMAGIQMLAGMAHFACALHARHGRALHKICFATYNVVQVCFICHLLCVLCGIVPFTLDAEVVAVSCAGHHTLRILRLLGSSLMAKTRICDVNLTMTATNSTHGLVAMTSA